jgi:energy-converting hydrogenase Eha subunit F
MSAITMRIGALFAFLGFGSLILKQLGRDFILISWADDMQPTFGVVLGIVGLVLIAVALLIGRAKAAPQPQQQFAQQPPAPGAPQAYPGRPQQQYPAQAQQQYPQQPGQPG